MNFVEHWHQIYKFQSSKNNNFSKVSNDWNAENIASSLETGMLIIIIDKNGKKR